MKTTRTTIAIIAAIVAGCSGSAEDERRGQSDDELFAEIRGLWPDSKNIPVCFEPEGAGTQGQRDEIRQAIESTWSAANSRIVFRGWSECGAQDRGIRILFGADGTGPRTQELGFRLDGMRNGMLLPNNLEDQAGQSPEWRKLLEPCLVGAQEATLCRKAIAIHEFGHALGLRHEQDRSDTPRPCDKEQKFSAGPGVTVGPYDRSSIMNYCKENRLFALGLSKGDKVAIRKLYAKGVDTEFKSDTGRPNQRLFTPGYSHAISGRPATLVIWYPQGVDPRQVSAGPNDIGVLVDGKQAIELAGSPWAPGPANSIFSAADFTVPFATGNRTIDVSFRGTYVASAAVGPVSAGGAFDKAVITKEGIAYVDVDLGSPPGYEDKMTIAGAFVTPVVGKAIWDAPELPSTTTCKRSGLGQRCRFQSKAPLPKNVDVGLFGAAQIPGLAGGEVFMAVVQVAGED